MMPKITVNSEWLDALLDPLAGGADDDAEVLHFQSFDPNDEAAVRAVIRERLVPYFRRMNAESVERIELTYRYYLQKPNYPWEHILPGLLIPFEAPRNPRDFFVWLLDECFPNHDWTLSDPDSYEEVRDIDEPRLIVRLKPETEHL
jgi:hypothetical protein